MGQAWVKLVKFDAASHCRYTAFELGTVPALTIIFGRPHLIDETVRLARVLFIKINCNLFTANYMCLLSLMQKESDTHLPLVAF